MGLRCTPRAPSSPGANALTAGACWAPTQHPPPCPPPPTLTASWVAGPLGMCLARVTWGFAHPTEQLQ